MKIFRFALVISIVFFLTQSCWAVEPPTSSAASISHDKWDKLLKKHVSAKGVVSYSGFKQDYAELKSYLDILSNSAPAENWTKDEKLTYWINAYNAFTVQLIVDNLDKKIKSIKDITGISIPLVKSPWDIKFIKISGKMYDLNQIEHGIVRKQFSEARIHFALVCAAKSCPSLRNEAYDAKKLNQQLDEQAVIFLNDPTKNKVSGTEMKLSPLFDWYASDFKDQMPIIDWAKKYAKTKPSDNLKLSYLGYDWSLNGK